MDEQLNKKMIIRNEDFRDNKGTTNWNKIKENSLR